jgi:hypothetical protein
MKKYAVLAVVAIFTMIFGAVAQNPGRGQGGMRGADPKEQTEQMAKQLELSDAQKEQVLALLEKQQKSNQERMEEMRKSREQGGQQQSREDFRAKFQEQQKANDAELEAIIGKEKMDKLKEIRAEEAKRRQEQGGDRQPRQGGRN